ncbi:MAG TPA: hypothetical protein VMT34_11235 [Aggregatilineales bacterium]|nr:hypothetical protein [Aggregatilineales bacterium]
MYDEDWQIVMAEQIARLRNATLCPLTPEQVTLIDLLDNVLTLRLRDKLVDFQRGLADQTITTSRDVAHYNLSVPFTYINAAVDLLLDPTTGPLDDDQVQALRRIRDYTRRIAGWVTEIMTLLPEG